MTQEEPREDAERHFRIDHLKANLGRRTARGGMVMMVSQSVKFVLMMGGTVVFGRLLSPQDYGLIGMVLILTGFMSLFRNMGLSAATMQRAELNNAQVSTLFWINVSVGLLLVLVTAALAPVVAWFYHEPRLIGITLALAIGFLFTGLTVQHEALLKRQMRFVSLALSENISLALSIVVGIIWAMNGGGYWTLVVNQLVLGFVYAVCVWLACRWRPGLPARDSGVRSMLVFGGNLTGYGFFNFFSRTLDNLLIGRFWGAQQLGLYAKAYQLLMMPIDQLSTPLDAVALPALSRLSDAPERYRSFYLRMLEKVAMLSMPGVALLIGTADWLVRLALGPQWTETGRIFALLGIVGIIEPVANTAGWLLISQGRARQLLHWGLIEGLLSALSIVLGLRWGAVGVAASFGIFGLCLRKPLLFWFVGRSGPVRTSDIYRTISPSACASIGVLAALFAFRRWAETPSPLFGLLAGFFIAVATSLVFFFVLPGGRVALQDIRSLVPALVKTRKAT